jgi:predicted nuclease with RNAse H fold
MYIAGLDLAALSKNPTGYAVFKNNKLIEVELLKKDKDIIKRLDTHTFSIVSVDAPLNVKSKQSRECDRLMKKYGAMPLKLNGMKMLADRAELLLKQLKSNKENQHINSHQEFIEVFPTGTAKILKFYNRDINIYKTNLIQTLNFFKISNSDLLEQTSTKHELDSVITGFTGWLFKKQLTASVGEMGAEIIIPDKQKIYANYDEAQLKKAVLTK